MPVWHIGNERPLYDPAGPWDPESTARQEQITWSVGAVT